jgi:spermidine/putrescine transport system permease protein
MPDILMGISLLALFVLSGVETGLLTIWIAHVTFCLSFVTMVVLGRLQDFDFTLDRCRPRSRRHADKGRPKGPAAPAASGCSRRRTAGLHAFDRRLRHHLLCLRPGTTTLPLRVASMMRTSRSLPMINALSTLLIASTFILALLSSRLQRRA